MTYMMRYFILLLNCMWIEAAHDFRDRIGTNGSMVYRA